MTAKAAAKTSANVSLHHGSSFPATWENVVLPWFKGVADSWQDRHGTIVVVPHRSYAHFLRARLLDADVPLLGVHFVAPAQLREMLFCGTETKLPLREHLRLLLAVAAERCISKGNEEQIAIAKSVARAPDHFLRAIDQVGAAGEKFGRLGPPTLREIHAQFQQLVTQCGFRLVHDADRAAVERGAKSPPRFNDALVVGFNAAHWPLWPLLRAAINSSTRATVVLADPRDEARDLDEAWAGTWEETFGAARPISALDESSTAPFTDLTRLPQIATSQPDFASNIHFLIGRETTQQAEAIVALTAKFLSENSADRIGILFSRRDALPRLVATLLEQWKIAHQDHIAHLQPAALNEAAWHAWLELQQSPRLAPLLKFLRSGGISSKLLDGLAITEVEDALRRAYGDVLIDDVNVLREFCDRDTGNKMSPRVAKTIAAIRFLPEEASLSDFLSATQNIFEKFGWIERWSEVERLSTSWGGGLTVSFSRQTFLRWLAEISASPAFHRDAHGDHPYSRVHLLTYEEAEGEQWSHLILAGLNEGEFPQPGDESGFISEEEIDEMNRRVRISNRRSLKQGRHGEGQWTVEEGKTIYLGAMERRQIAMRQFFNLIESTEQKIAVTANLLHQATPERTWNPSEFFSRLYFAARGKPLSQALMRNLEAETRSWLRDAARGSRAEVVEPLAIAQTRIAYDARRRQGVSTDYEFALRKPPDRPISIRVTDWERALKSPGLVWLKIFLGVEANDESGDAWSKSTGQWVHHWLAQSAGSSDENRFVALPDENAIQSRLIATALKARQDVQQLCDACGRALPDWWISGWSNALYIADCLAANLTSLNDWSHLATEWRLDSPQVITLEKGKQLRIRGRIDLIFARGEQSSSPLPYRDLWVIDYKTGRKRSFNLREFRKGETSDEKFGKKLTSGEAVQLGLYALAARQLGASTVKLTLLNRSSELAPQFCLEDVAAQSDFWNELHRMQESGVFGMLGPVRPKYSASPAYPLATLTVDPEIVNEKWAITHPAFGPVENESFES